MNDFNPGDGWHEVPAFTKANGSRCLIEFDERGDDVRMWLPETPVPPLPTEPYTVIRAWVEGSDGPRVYVRAEGGVWFRAGETSTLRARVLRFEVLAEPRAVSLERMVARDMEVRKATAKAVLDRVRERSNARWLSDMTEPLNDIAREFGVEA